MKTKRVVVGAVAAAMLSLSICSAAPVVAADETVQISVGTAEVKAGEQFTVKVSMADIPAAGIQALDFAVGYDSSLITIDSVEAGALTETGAESQDSTGSLAPIFDKSINNSEGYVSLIWSTAIDDATYWLKGDGVFCTITGTVASSAKEGSKIPLTVAAIDRETYDGSGVKADIVCGYTSSNGTVVNYNVKTTDGYVQISGGSSNTGVRGDANCDGEVGMADAVLIMQRIANPNRYGESGSEPGHITEQGVLNGDVYGGESGKGGDGLTTSDALQIQKYLLKLVTEL